MAYNEAFYHHEDEDLVVNNDVAYSEENLNETLEHKHFACLNQNDEVNFYDDNVLVFHEMMI
jgi:DNA repair exonuclease SbcCD nuclease subunit